MKSSLPLLFLLVALRTAAAAPDTLVVCPTEFRAALAPWEEFRRSQGHELEIVDVPRDRAELQAAVRRIAAGGRLEYLVLVGDVPTPSTPPEARPKLIPTNYAAAKINVRWGSESTIASDTPFADVDGDGSPDLAVGRIPADSPAQLAAVVRKIIRYETRADREPWDRRVAAVAGNGGFGVMADALIEAAGQQIMSQALPPGYLVALTRAKTGAAVLAPIAALNNTPRPKPQPDRLPIGQQMEDGSLLWVYLGHAYADTLDYVSGPAGPESILHVDDVSKLHCGARCPLALLVACYTGAYDASRDCLAEELLLAEEGPVAVVAATRVSMPYGNTILSYEFLRASLVDQKATLGAALRLAQQRTLATGDGDAMRKSLDTMAVGLGPLLDRGNGPRWQPEDLVAERREHVAMYQLFGDPLLRWRRPKPMAVSVPADVAPGGTLSIAGKAEFDGQCLFELARSGAEAKQEGAADKNVIASTTKSLRSGEFAVALPIPADASGRYVVRAYLQGQRTSALGGANIVVRQKAD